MKALYAEFMAKEGSEDELAGLVRELTAAVRAEPGNVVFDPYVREADPRSWVVFEVYRDDDAFEQHITSEHSRAFNAALGDLIEGDGSTLTWLRDAG